MELEQALADARAAVVRDLAGPAPATASPWEPALDAAVAARRWWVAQWPAGAPYVLGLLAQDVQEVVHAIDPTWPLCTETSCPERSAHALFVEPDLGEDPFWTCHRTGLPVAPVGALRG